MSPAPGDRDFIGDAATRLALDRLAESRLRLADWSAQMATRIPSRGPLGFLENFSPRSKTLQMLMSLALPRLPWMRWAFSALLMLRSWRRR